MSHTIKQKADADKDETTPTGDAEQAEQAEQADAPSAPQDIVDSGAHPKTPLEMAREQRARMQNHEVEQQRVDASADVPGHATPSDRRHHPQRQTNYGVK